MLFDGMILEGLVVVLEKTHRTIEQATLDKYCEFASGALMNTERLNQIKKGFSEYRP
jgi:hypothetical protein